VGRSGAASREAAINRLKGLGPRRMLEFFT